ncbi:MAG: right-handed parallel beta-helix repeat-containing protein [Myxococcota bacterium]
MKRIAFPRSLTLPLLLAAIATACDPVEADTDGAATDTDDSGDPSGDPSDPTGEDTDDDSTGQTADCAPLMQEDIAGDTTLEAGCYEVQNLLTVDAALTIEAGAQLRFSDFSGLFVVPGGSLATNGTPDDPVLFAPIGSNWVGIGFSGSSSPNNRLEGADIRGVNGNGIELSSSTLAVVNSTVAENTEYALLTDDVSTFTISGSTFTANNSPAEVGLTQVEGFAADNDFTGNDDDVIIVRRATLEDDATWVNVGVPLQLTGDVFVNGDWVLEAGLTLLMPQDARLSISTTGSLASNGADGNPVTLRGTEEQPSYWKGIQFQSKATANGLSFTRLENAGSSAWNGNSITNAAVWLDADSKVVVANSEIRGSGGAAVMGLSGADLSGFENNVIENNEESLVFTPSIASYLDGSNTFANNGDDVIEIYETFNEDGQLADHAWSNPGIPYRIMERINGSGDWVIEPGVEIQIAQDVNIVIEDTGSINAVGTDAEPIRVVGAEPLQGYWQGIEIHSVSASNVFDNVEMRHGGSAGFNGSEDSDGTLFIGGFGGDGSVTIRNSTVADSGGYGLVVWSNSDLLDCGSVTFEGNAKADVFVEQNGGSSAC